MRSVILLFVTGIAVSSDWSEWRGLRRDGISPESSGWRDRWHLNKLWEKNVGLGCTSPIIVKGKLYVIGWSWNGRGRPRGNPLGDDTLYCFDSRTGRELWRQSYPSQFQGRFRTGDTRAYGGPSATPTFDLSTGYLHTLSVDGEFRCWDTNLKGKPVWSKNLYDEYSVTRRPYVGGGVRDYGFVCSPLLYKDTLIAEVGAKKGTIIAFDKKTGEQRWGSEHNSPAGHTTSPVLFKLGEIPCLAVLTLKDLVVMSLEPGKEGKTLGTYHWQTDFACNIPGPVAVENKLIITSAYNHRRMALLEVSESGIKMKWLSKAYAPVSTPLIYERRVFVIAGKLRAVDIETGDVLWSAGDFGHGSCLATAGDGKLVVFGRGKLALIDPRDGRILASLSGVVPGTCYPHIALSDGVIACKDRDGNLVCFGLQ